MQLRLGCSYRYPQQIRDLVMLVSLDVVQNENLPCAVRKPCERHVEIHREVTGSLLRGKRFEDPVAVHVSLPSRGVRPEAFDDHVGGKAVEPRSERRLAAKARELLPHADEDILRQLLRIPSRRHATNQAMDARQMRTVEPLERACVSRRGQRHVIGGVGGSYGRQRCSNLQQCGFRRKLLSCTSLDGAGSSEGWNVTAGSGRGRWEFPPTSVSHW